MTSQGLVTGLPKLSKYELVEEIGHGGMATVYRARDPRLGRDVAIKLIHKHLRENPEVAKRFVDEARAAAKLRHQAIVDVYDVSGPEDDERYLVVELVRGTTLRKLLQKHRDMPAEIGAAIVFVLCEALEHAHASGIIHRDVKPENVLVELPSDGDEAAYEKAPDSGTVRKIDVSAAQDGESAQAQAEGDDSQNPGHAAARENVSANAFAAPKKRSNTGVIIKLTDFGIAKLLDSQGVTSTGQVLGSPAHMAPEQIEGKEVDPRTDVFALGVLMYECLAGHLPFEGKNPAQVLRRVLDGDYPPAEREKPSLGGRFSRLLDAALAHDPGARLAGPAALGERILAELKEAGITEPRAAIADYFSDPEGYTRAFYETLVPLLVSRGEQARKAGDIPGAASDFNRALALKPDDLAILKHLGSLSAGESRKRLLRRFGIALVACAALGVGGFFTARLWSSRNTSAPSPESTATSASQVQPSPEPRAPSPQQKSQAPAPHEKTQPSAEPSSEAGKPYVRATAAPSPVSGGPPAPRKVRFTLVPHGAKLTLDGQNAAWFGNTFSLTTGAHSVRIAVPDSKCCKPYDGTFTVVPAPPSKPDDIQAVVIKLDALPATVTLVGAPPNAQYTCPGLGLIGFAGTARQVPMSDAIWIGSCEFKLPSPTSNPRKATITLKAGENNSISWPSG